MASALFSKGATLHEGSRHPSAFRARAGRPVVQATYARVGLAGSTALHGRSQKLCSFSVVSSRPGRSRARNVSVQANLFTRIQRIINASLGNAVSSLEDPEKLLDRIVEEMQDDYRRMNQAYARVLASQRQMEAKQKSLQENAEVWLRRAETAVARNEDELAKEALGRRRVLQGDADKLSRQLGEQVKAAEQLRANLATLDAKIKEASGKKQTLKARAASARSSKEIQDMIGGLKMDTSTAFAAFDKLEEKVLAMEAETEGTQALIAPEGLELRFKSLEASDVDRDLALLKQAGPRALLTDVTSANQQQGAGAAAQQQVHSQGQRTETEQEKRERIGREVERQMQVLRGQASDGGSGSSNKWW